MTPAGKKERLNKAPGKRLKDLKPDVCCRDEDTARLKEVKEALESD